jgi:hypothetical protein
MEMIGETSSRERLTAGILSCFNRPWTDAQEQNALIRILGVIFGYGCIQRSLTDRIRAGNLDIVPHGKIVVGKPAGEGNDLFGIAVEDKRHIEVEQVYVAYDIDFK